MANKYAHYRGQRFKVVNEDGKFVTLEGYGYVKRHLKDEVIFEEQPEDTLVVASDEPVALTTIDPNTVVDIPKERKDLDLVQKAMESQKPVFDRSDLEDDLVDQDPNFKPKAPDVELDQLTNREKHAMSTANTMPLSVAKSDPSLQLAQEAVPAQVVPSPEFTQTESPVGTKDYPNFPKIGIDTSIFSADQRHSENEKRRKDALAVFKEKLQGMLREIDTMEMSEALDEATEGVDAPYETFEQFMQDFLAFAKANDFISPENEIDVDSAVMQFSGDKHAAEFIKQLGGVGKVEMIMKKKVAEMGLTPAEGALAESLPPVTAPPGAAMPANDNDAALQSKLGGPISPPVLQEDGAAPASAGGGVPNASGSVEVASTTGPGTTTANVANFNARLGVDPKKKHLNEEQK